MPRKTLKLLDDIRDAAAFILELVRERTLADYESNRALRQAAERNFEIIGEAMNRIVKDDPATAERIGDYPRIIAFRNLLIHGYDLIEDKRVWQIIQEQLPALERTVDAILREVGGKGQDAND